jgi:hypothetical protein
VIHVPDRPNVHMRLGALEFAFCHDLFRSSCLSMLPVTWCP